MHYQSPSNKYQTPLSKINSVTDHKYMYNCIYFITFVIKIFLLFDIKCFDYRHGDSVINNFCIVYHSLVEYSVKLITYETGFVNNSFQSI